MKTLPYYEKYRRLTQMVKESVNSWCFNSERAERLMAFVEELEDSGSEFSNQLFDMLSGNLEPEIHLLDELIGQQMKEATLTNFRFDELSERQRVAVLVSVLIVAGMMRRQNSRRLKDIIQNTA